MRAEVEVVAAAQAQQVGGGGVDAVDLVAAVVGNAVEAELVFGVRDAGVGIAGQDAAVAAAASEGAGDAETAVPSPVERVLGMDGEGKGEGAEGGE